MRHSLMGVADALAISKATLRNMKQNLLGAFVYNSARHSDCRRDFVAADRYPAEPGCCGCGDGALVNYRGEQR